MRRGALALCVAAGLSAAVPAGAAGGFAGVWSGVIQPGEGEAVTVTLTLERTVGGAWRGTLDAPSWAPEPVALEALSMSAEGIFFSVTGLPRAPQFVGRLSEDGASIEGSVFLEPPPPPLSTDIYLIPVETGGGRWELGSPVRITDRDGYDNQPRFLPGGSGLLYTSIREGQADVYRYDLDTGISSRLTSTGESEYSPTPLPSGDGFSTVRVEDDGTQRLWSFDPRGREPVLILAELEPVGYHGWLDDHRLGVFVLGSPPTLHLAEADRRSSRVIAENVGRSIHRTPDGAGVSFVHKASETDWTIERIDLETGERRTLIATRPGSEDFVWAPDGRILMGEGSTLFACSPDDDAPRWEEIADLGADGVYRITRLDVSSDSRRLAVVGDRPASGAVAERVVEPFTLRRSVRPSGG